MLHNLLKAALNQIPATSCVLTFVFNPQLSGVLTFMVSGWCAHRGGSSRTATSCCAS